MYPFTVLYSQYKLTSCIKGMLNLIIISYKLTTCLYLYLKEYLQYPVKYMYNKMLCGFNRTLSNDEQTKNPLYYFLLHDQQPMLQGLLTVLVFYPLQFISLITSGPGKSWVFTHILRVVRSVLQGHKYDPRVEYSTPPPPIFN